MGASLNSSLVYNLALEEQHFKLSLSNTLIKIIAPASGYSEEKINRLKGLNQAFPWLKIEWPETLIKKGSVFHASDDKTRLEQLKRALYLDVPGDEVIWVLRGGYGCARLLDELSLLAAPKKIKPLIGFSDITALHLFLSQHWHWPCIHGSVFSQFLDKNQEPENFYRIVRLLRWLKSLSAGINPSAKRLKPSLLSDLKPMNHAAAEVQSLRGGLTGGNLTLVETSIGTPWEIQTKDRIIFLEEVGEKGYRIDRSLLHLKQASIFSQAKALIFGEFLNEETNANLEFALERFAKDLRLPVYKSEQFGHGVKNYPLLYEVKAEIKAGTESYSLSLSES